MPISSFSYSIPYLLLLTIYIVLAIFEYQKGRQINVVQFICVTSFLVFFGLRGFVGWDWYSYYKMYAGVHPVWDDFLLNYSSVSDFGYTTYMALIKSFGVDYQVFLFISVLIDILVLNWFFKRYSANYAFSFAVFMFACLAIEIDTYRSMKALEIFLLSIPFIEKRRALGFFSLGILAVLFHVSSVIFLPLYFFLHKRVPLIVFITIFVIGNIIYLLQLPILSPILKAVGSFTPDRLSFMINIYTDSEIYSVPKGITPSYLERILTAVLLLCFYTKITTIRSSNVIFVNLFLLYLIATLYCSEMTIIESRVGGMFIICYTVIWPMIVDSFSIRGNRQIIFTLFVTMIYIFLSLRTNNIMYLYENVLFDSRTYEQRAIIFEDQGAQMMLN